MAKSVKSIFEKVKTKCGTVKRFCTLSGLNYYTVTNALNNRLCETKTSWILEQIELELGKLQPVQCLECINTKEREKVRIALVTRWKTMKSFCEAHPGFSQTFVHNVIAGKRKEKDGRYLNLCKALNLKQQQQ
jgi:hypothetical protein